MPTETKKINAAQARARIKAYLIERHHADTREADEIVLWTKAEASERGWYAGDKSGGQVVWEGGPYEWAYDLTDALAEGKLDLPGWWLECATSFIVTLYPREA